MRDEAAAIELPPAAVPHHVRVRAGLRRPGNWLELGRFGLVGGSGYVVNLLVFTVAVHAFDVAPLLAAVCAFVVAVTNNFAWNRLWTFRAREGHAGFQAARFLVVSLAGLAVNLAVLAVLVDHVPEVAAQAIAVATAFPVTFLGNKLWTFDA